jgi:ligand-binding sensor domain-containing protein
LKWRDGIVRTLTAADGLPDSAVRALYEDPAGQLWIGTAGGLAVHAALKT